MAFIGAKTLLCLVAALAAGTTTARSVVVERDAAVADGDEYVVVVDSEAKVADGGQYEVETESDIVFGNVTEGRKKRQVDPTWSCTGAFSEDWNIYNVHCETNLEVVGVDCTLDGQDYTSSELDFSVDTSGFVGGEQHVLVITVSARYGFSTGILRYTFRFIRQVTINTVSCRSRTSGGNVVITCSGSGITRIKYRVNNGSYQNANSVSEFTVLGSQLAVGTNTISLRITVSGVIRTLTLTAQKIVVAVFNPTCSVSYDSDWNVGCTCVGGGGGSEAIQSITYTINGGIQRTASSVSQFQINKNFLQFGQNTIIITFTSASAVVRTATFQVTRTRVFNPSSTYSYDSKGNVLVTCSQSSDSEVIQSITYTINRGSQRTVSSISRFQIDVNNLLIGQNMIRITFTSVSRVVRTINLQVTRTQARFFSVRCQASYNTNNNANINCSTQSVDSEAIASIQYRINGGTLRTASSVSSFEIYRSLLTREVNTIVVTLTSTGQLSRDITLSLVQPLSLQCRSQTSSTGVTVTCQTNRQSSTVTVQCYLDGVLQPTSGLNTALDFSRVTQGRHTYEVVITDSNSLTVRNQLSFENQLTITCRGSLNLGYGIYAVVCDSDRILSYTCTIDGVLVTYPTSLEIDISTLQAGLHTLLITGIDLYRNTATFTTQFTIPQELGSCNIDSDAFDGAINWICSINVAGVSIVCLVDNIRLEDCLCQLQSEFYTERYSDGDHRVSLILTGRDGPSKRFDQVFTVQALTTSISRAIEPLEFKCASQLNDENVVIDCSSNKPIELTCYLDDVEQSSCQLTSNEVAFSDISQGPHTYTVIATDEDGLVDHSEVHFEEDLTISCRGSYSPEYDVVHLDCDSTRPLTTTQCQLDDGTVTDCHTPIDVPVSDFVNSLTLRVRGQDNVGNTDSEQLTFRTSSCENC